MAKKESVNIRTQTIYAFLPILSIYAFYRVEKIGALIIWSIIQAVIVIAIVGGTFGIALALSPLAWIISAIFWTWMLRKWSREWNASLSAVSDQDNV